MTQIGQHIEWTAAEVFTLRRMWPKHSAKEIASRLNTTRNSVIGKAHRLGLPAKASGHAEYAKVRSDDTKATFRALWLSSSLTFKGISDRMRIPMQTLRRLKREMGLPDRGPGGKRSLSVM